MNGIQHVHNFQFDDNGMYKYESCEIQMEELITMVCTSTKVVENGRVS